MITSSYAAGQTDVDAAEVMNDEYAGIALGMITDALLGYMHGVSVMCFQW